MVDINTEEVRSSVEKIRSTRTATWQTIEGLRASFKGEEETNPKYLPTYIKKLFEALTSDFNTRIPAWETSILEYLNTLEAKEKTDPPKTVSPGGSSSGSANTNDPGDIGEEPVDKPPLDPVKPSDIENLPINDLRNISDSLYDVLKDTTLENYLGDTNNHEDLKKMLEALPLSETLKQQLSNMEAKDLADLLKDIYTGNRMDLITLSDNSKNVLHNYLSEIALNNGITLNDLLTNSKYADLLKAELGKLDGIDNYLESLLSQDSTTIQQNLLYVYNGNLSENINENTMNIIRILSDQMAEEKNISVEELYTNIEYSDFIKERITDMEHTTSFMKVLSKTESSTSQTLTSKVLNGVSGFTMNHEGTIANPTYEQIMDAAKNGTVIESITKEPIEVPAIGNMTSDMIGNITNEIDYSEILSGSEEELLN